MRNLALTRLIVAGDRASRRRLLGMVAGITVGVALFLILLSAAQAFPERSARSSWASLSVENSRTLEPGQTLAGDELAAATTLDIHNGQAITVLKVARPEGGTSARIPGSDIIPEPGQYLASPALVQLIDSVPANELEERYGERVGTLDPGAVEGPDSLVAVVGAGLETVAATDGQTPAQVVTELVGTPFASRSYQTVTIIGAIAVLIPAFLLVGIVTDLGAAQRAERFAALRLIGATPQQVARTAALETAATTLIGSLAGAGLYLAMIPVAAQITLASSRFYPSDLLASPIQILGAIVLTVVGSSAVAWWRTRRADLGPLGGARERREKRPRVISLLPLALGVTGLLSSLGLRDHNPNLVGLLIIASFIATMFGILWAGPLVTWATARAGQARARTAAQVIGCGRIAQHPRAVFRTVAGMVAAIYAVTVFAVAIAAAAGTGTVTQGGGRLSPTALQVMPGTADAGTIAQAAAEIAAMPGVTTVAQGSIVGGQDGAGRLILPAAQAQALGASPTSGSTGLVSISTEWLFFDRPMTPSQAPPREQWEEQAQPILLVDTAGNDHRTIEHIRTALAASDLNLRSSPVSRMDMRVYQGGALENQFASLGYIGILVAAGISAVSLGVSSVGALLNRRRVLGLLRLVGMPVRTVGAVISYETAIPVATVLVGSIALGALTGWSLISGVSRRTVDWPSAGYFLVLAICLALVGLAVAATTRASRRMLADSTVRFE